MKIINFKDTDELKQALRMAAIKAEKPNVSRFLSDIVRNNPLVAKELKIMKNKVK